MTSVTLTLEARYEALARRLKAPDGSWPLLEPCQGCSDCTADESKWSYGELPTCDNTRFFPKPLHLERLFIASVLVRNSQGYAFAGSLIEAIWDAAAEDDEEAVLEAAVAALEREVKA